jgi:serine O-acetyltransferase
MTREEAIRLVSSTVPDWSREECIRGQWNPSRRLLRAIRRYQRWRGKWGFIGRLIQKLTVLEHRFWTVVCGCDIPVNVNVAGGLLLTHPSGIVIAPGAEIGPNCLFFQQVTVGTGGKTPGYPRVGGHVDVGAGAKILGGIVVGDHAVIGANAVVLEDVPAGATAVGIPARVVNRPELRALVLSLNPEAERRHSDG